MEKNMEKSVEQEVPETEKEWLKIKLKTPVEFQGMSVSEVDLSGMEDMTGQDLNVVYDLYAGMGGSRSIMQESTLLFAQIIASKATGHPVELFYKMKARDAMIMKNRVYRFFFLEA